MSAELKRQIEAETKGEPASTWTVKSIIKLILMHKHEVSSDDVRFYVSKFTPSPNVVGSAFQALFKEGVLKKKGTQRSASPSAKGRTITIYESAA